MGGYRFSLYDQDDPFEGLGTQQPTAAAPQQQPAAAAPQQQRDTELDNAWRDRELQELNASKGSEYGFGEGVRDVLPALLALGLDAGFNKGRGAGGILQGTADVAARGEAVREARRRASGEQALKIHQRDKGYIDPTYRWAALDARKDAAGGVQNRWATTRDDRNDPNSQRNTTAQGQAFEVKRQGEMGVQEGRHLYAPTRAEDESLIAGSKATATTNADTDALRGNPRELTEDQKIDNDLQREQLALSTDLRNQGNQRAADEARARRVESFNTENKDVLDVAAAASELRGFFEKQRAKGVTDMPGLGPLDSGMDERWPTMLGGPNEDDKYVRNLTATLRNPGVHARFGAAVTASEKESAEREFGAMKGGDEAASLQAIESLYKLSREKLRAAALADPEVAREILRTRGLADLMDGPGDPSNSPTRQAPGGGEQLPGEAVPASLGVTSGRVPPIPIKPPSASRPAAVAPGQVPGGMVTVRLGSKVAQVTAEEAEALQQLDQGVEVLQ